ncbi:hypothetical protein DFH09DRAFT_1498085 [Mycena vulgaris]|nr:hypothetical protein DFH09DRAFT_1498085 [Mycena vulgaris]
MASHPSLGFLKKGLSTLKDSVKKHKDDFTACLKKAEKISDADVAWLDDAANHVEEDAVIEKLENASDYERGFARLDEKEDRLDDKLKGGSLSGTQADKKRGTACDVDPS